MIARIMAVLFILLGCGIVFAALTPALSHPPGSISLALTITGIVVAVLGGLVYPSSGVGPALDKVVVVVGPYVPRIPGVSRSTDPKPDDKG